MNNKQQALLSLIISDTKLFDPADNTIINSNRETAEKLGVDRNQINRLFSAMVKEGLAKKVTAINSRKIKHKGVMQLEAAVSPQKSRVETYMLHPEHYGKQEVKFEQRFRMIMWILGSYDAACEHMELERQLHSFIDPETGEMEEMPMGYLASLRRYQDNYMFDKATKHRKTGDRLSSYRMGDNHGCPEFSTDELGLYVVSGQEIPKGDTQRLNRLIKEELQNV